MRCLEIICYGYLTKAESDWGIIGNQAVLFYDLHFPNRYDICSMTLGARLIMLLAGLALFCILQMLHPVVCSFMPLLRHSLKICGVVWMLYIMCYRTEMKMTFSGLSQHYDICSLWQQAYHLGGLQDYRYTLLNRKRDYFTDSHVLLLKYIQIEKKGFYLIIILIY